MSLGFTNLKNRLHDLNLCQRNNHGCIKKKVITYTEELIEHSTVQYLRVNYLYYCRMALVSMSSYKTI